MKFYSCNTNRRRKSPAGFTIIEMLTSVVLGMFLLATVAILYINGNQCFVAMANYQNLDKYSYSAMDILSREIRGASAVTFTNATSIQLANATKGTTIIITYTNNMLILSGTQLQAEYGPNTLTMTNLTGCSFWSYSLFNGAPIISATDVTFNPPASLAQTKVVQMNWTCSRTYIGSKLNTESVQTAQIVLRNNTSN
jgi:Tfp pilus assembly protein PilW